MAHYGRGHGVTDGEAGLKEQRQDVLVQGHVGLFKDVDRVDADGVSAAEALETTF